MMKLSDRLHCPSCKGRLAPVSVNLLGCDKCDRTIPLVDGVGDFVGDAVASGMHPDLYHSSPHQYGLEAAELFGRMQTAAGDLWPGFLGDVVTFGCGPDEAVRSIVSGQMFRSLLLLDSDINLLQACRIQATSLCSGLDLPVAYATLSGRQDAVRDAVADTVLGLGLLSCIGDVRSFLMTVYRVLKPGGRAAFTIPNRRFYQAMCSAIAEALVQRYARDRAWSGAQAVLLEFLAQTRRLLVHREDLGFLSGLQEKHLFDIDKLQDLGEEVGFATVEMIPLYPDPVGIETIRQICRQAGADDDFMKSFAPLAGAVGRPYFNLLGRQDASSSMLLWLTKGLGPTVRIFKHRPAPPSMDFAESEAALGGVAPRWSIELSARDTSAGILVAIGGWCLFNADILWVRITMGDVMRYAPVWRPRPDVHEVLNQSGLYHSVNTLCSGLDNELLFAGLHPTDNQCPLRVDILLSGGMIVVDPAPKMLMMNEPMVIAH